MRILPLALTLLLASPTFAQQAPAQSGAEAGAPAVNPAQTISPDAQRRLQEGLVKLQAQMRAQLNACPVGFSVDRKSKPNLEVAKDSGAELRQGLDVSLRTNERKIVEADITVHGMVFRPRVIGASAGDAEDLPEEFVLKGTADEPVQLSSVRLQRLGTVSWVELMRVVYSDGTVWTPKDNGHCTARPSMLVLVNGPAQLK